MLKAPEDDPLRQVSFDPITQTGWTMAMVNGAVVVPSKTGCVKPLMTYDL